MRAVRRRDRIAIGDIVSCTNRNGLLRFSSSRSGFCSCWSCSWRSTSPEWTTPPDLDAVFEPAPPPEIEAASDRAIERTLLALAERTTPILWLLDDSATLRQTVTPNHELDRHTLLERFIAETDLRFAPERIARFSLGTTLEPIHGLIDVRQRPFTAMRLGYRLARPRRATRTGALSHRPSRR